MAVTAQELKTTRKHGRKQLNKTQINKITPPGLLQMRQHPIGKRVRSRISDKRPRAHLSKTPPSFQLPSPLSPDV
jgi:hypothetical protein